VKRNNNGFTLVEMMLVLAIIGILMAVSAPGIMTWIRMAQYRGVAQEVDSALRETRSRAITNNRQHRIVFFVGDGRQRFRVEGSNGGIWTTLRQWEVPATVRLTGNLTPLVFNPNGSAGADTVNICDVNDSVKVRVILASSGRVRIDSP